MKRKKTEYYVNNKEFLAAITAYREQVHAAEEAGEARPRVCLLYTSPSPRDAQLSRMPSSA